MSTIKNPILRNVARFFDLTGLGTAKEPLSEGERFEYVRAFAGHCTKVRVSADGSLEEFPYRIDHADICTLEGPHPHSKPQESRAAALEPDSDGDTGSLQTKKEPAE